jgi:hypothetical protein
MIRGLLYDVLKIVLLILFPFAILIRSATYIHNQYDVFSMTSLLAASIFTTILLFIYFSFFYGKLTGRFGDFNAMKRRALIAFLMVAVYSLHGILFFSSSNLKNPALKSEINGLHPILRLGMSTLVYIDNDLIITDATRAPEDYKKMGLPTKRASLHYTQESSNYAHAVDIHTKNRGEWKNFLVKKYFDLLGFNTLRHGGTADHLHVSIKSHDFPNAR